MTRRGLVALLLAWAIPAIAQDARGLVETINRRALAIFAAGGPGDEAGRAALRAILADSFDLPAIARFCTGPAWDNANAEQRARFLAAFERRIIDQFARRYREYAGTTMELVGERAGADGERLVATRFARAGEAGTTLVWRVRGGRVVDVQVNGTSTAITQRDEFAPTLRANGNDLDVLTRLLAAAR